ncbi:hypothetical protein BDQ12DRAFT_499978 [Crucibulum laeve]|uniref:Uncharacterized protein n=1 Tax=Crucibulum laeve TaxID=68775 RepID=A0A5C3LIW6_9AGAR|nr:hypothetical protein BDQ12DRAFT_499978 [Crucibulum laeve]
MFTVVQARVTAAFVDTVFFGLSLVSVWYTFQALLRTVDGKRWKRIGEANPVMIGVTTLMFLNYTMATSTTIILFYKAFASQHYSETEASRIYNDISSWTIVLEASTPHPHYAIQPLLI